MGVPFVKNFDDLAENIANPNPNRPISNAVGQFGRQVCDSISARPDLYAPTILQSPLRAACQPYWDSQDYDGPIEERPFEGGQCADNYTVTVLILGNPLNVGGESPKTITGPLGGVSRTETQVSGGPFPEFEVVWAFSNDPINKRVTVRLNQGQLDASSISVAPQSGNPDNCGDPPGEFVPGGNPAPDPGPLPPGTGPQFDIRGNPFFVLPPTLEIAPDFNFEIPIGEINLGSGTGNSPPAEPLPGSEMEGSGSGVGGGEDDFPEPPDGERWVGCCVRITARPVGHGSIPQSEPETIFPDIIGNVRLKFSSTSQLPAYDTPLINKSKSLCVWEPVRGMQPIGVRVNLRPGFEYSYTPYSVPLEN